MSFSKIYTLSSFHTYLTLLICVPFHFQWIPELQIVQV